jgi:hypothetical protein
VTHPVLAGLRSEDPEERRAACRAAAGDPSAVLLVGALCEALGDPSPTVARAASDALVALGQRDAEVKTALGDLLHGAAPESRLRAALTWGRIEPPPIRLLPALVDALDHPDGDVRWEAARQLVAMGRLERDVLPVLLQLAAAADRPAARRMAVHALRQLAPEARETAHALLAASRAADAVLRRASLAAMSALLDPPAEVVVRLVEALLDTADPAGRRIATAALAQLGARAPETLSEDALEALRRAAADPSDADLRRGGARALERIAAARTR